jgi:hypothetical protein
MEPSGMKIHGSLILISALALSACDSGSNNNDTSAFVVGATSVSPGGIYTGSVANSDALALITEKGEFHIVIPEGNIHYVGQMQSSPTGMTATLAGVTELGSTFGDGSRTGTGTMTGVVSPRDGIGATLTFRTANGTTSTSQVVLDFDTSYLTPGGLQQLQGTYGSSGSAGITDSGTFSSFDASTNCAGLGTIQILDLRYNMFYVKYSYTGCAGASAVLNNVEFTGFAVTGQSSGDTGSGGQQISVLSSTNAANQAEFIVVRLITDPRDLP